MFLRPPLSPLLPLPLKVCARMREKQRESQPLPLSGLEGKLELFITGSFPILHGIAPAKGETRAIHRRYLRGEERREPRSRASMTRRRPSEISRDWRGEIAGQIGWAPGITVMRSRAIVFEYGDGVRGEMVFRDVDGG